jgi:hypothetical protein
MIRFDSFPSHRTLLAAVATTLWMITIAYAQSPQPADPKAGPAPAIDAASPAPVAPGSVQPAAPEGAAPAPAVQAPVRRLSPMMAEMQTVLAAENEKLAELRQRVRSAPTPDEALAIQRDIERLKFETEVSLLRVQAKHARAAGRTEVASRIEMAIAELVHPPKPVAPAARPVPVREPSSR